MFFMFWLINKIKYQGNGSVISDALLYLQFNINEIKTPQNSLKIAKPQIYIILSNIHETTKFNTIEYETTKKQRLLKISIYFSFRYLYAFILFRYRPFHTKTM